MSDSVTDAGLTERNADAPGDPRLTPFIDAVAAQLARSGGEDADALRARGDWWRAQLGSILASIGRGASEPVCTRLASDAELLAAFFQNVDLLYAASAPHADAVSVVILDSLHRAVEADAAENPAGGGEAHPIDRPRG